MKRKQFSKKLVLNKKTIADLSYGEMKGVQGGSATEQIVCCPQTLTDAGCPQQYKTECCPQTYTDAGCPMQYKTECCL